MDADSFGITRNVQVSTQCTDQIEPSVRVEACDLFPFIIFQQQLREAHEAIADNVSVIEEKDRVIVLKSRKNEELAREKQVRLQTNTNLDGRSAVPGACLLDCVSSGRISPAISRSCVG